MTTQIHVRALLVSLTISTWTARKYDRSVTRKVNADYNASQDAGRYNKMLLPGDADSYKALMTLAGAIRGQHYVNTLAWSDEGWRLLPTANFVQYSDWYRQQQRAFSNALDAFAADYPMLRTRARTLLNNLYKDEDYPSTMDIRSKFAIGINYLPVPAEGDIRVDLASDQVEMIEATIAHRIQEATQTAMSDAWERLHDVVSKIAERLSTPDAIFRDSLINNAREICSVLRRLNVTNDADLEQMRQAVERQLTKYDPDVLRDTPDVRQQVADRANAILSVMNGLYKAA